MGNFHHRALMVSASFSAYAAPALMIVCLLTDYWIHGKQTRLSTNPVVKAGDIRVLNFTYHRIGLWRECFKETVDIEYTCEIVKYSKTEAKLEKGFKAVACKIFSLNSRPNEERRRFHDRSICTKYGLFYRCISALKRRHLPIHSWSL